MQILFLTQVLPYPLDAGPKVRAYFVLRYLAQFHSVTLLSFVRATDSQLAIDHLKSLCQNVYLVNMDRSMSRDLKSLAFSLSSSTPFLIHRDRRSAMFAQIEQVVNEAAASNRPFDAVHADQSWMAPYALHAHKVAPVACKPLRVLDQHNAVYLITQRMGERDANPLKRLLLTHEARKMARWEVETCHNFDRVSWVTQQDLDAVRAKARQLGSPQQIRSDGVIPICGDPEATDALDIPTGANRVTFLGGLHYPPNAQGILWFAKEIFPAILRSVPNAVLTVIGKQPPPELSTLGIPPANLEITGYVDDPLRWLRETAVFVVPLLAGGGMRVKIIDGWVWGLPIVSTTIGAEGIDLVDGENILLADTPGDFTSAVIGLLTDTERQRKIAAAGKAWVLEHYNWRTTYRLWNVIYPPQSQLGSAKDVVN